MNTTEETKVSAEVPQQAPEINFDRVLVDEAYAAEVNKQLASGTEQSEAPAQEEATAAPETAAVEAPKADEKPQPDPEEVVETITYRGQEVPVKRREMKDLLQKGRHLEVRMQEVSPYLALAREVPEVGDLARTPEGRQQIAERIRMKAQQAAPADDVPEVEGYDKDDVRAVDKIVRERMKALGIDPEQAKPSPEVLAAQRREQEEIATKSRITLESLRSVDPHFSANMELVKTVVAEVERTAPPEQFREFYRVINDPRAINPTTGRPAFLEFYADVDRRRREIESQRAAPQVQPRVQAPPAARLAPGAATAPAISATRGRSWMDVPKEDFDRAFNEALSRG